MLKMAEIATEKDAAVFPLLKCNRCIVFNQYIFHSENVKFLWYYLLMQ